MAPLRIAAPYLFLGSRGIATEKSLRRTAIRRMGVFGGMGSDSSSEGIFDPVEKSVETDSRKPLKPMPENVKVHHTTVALIPPDEAWKDIQRVRFEDPRP